MTEDSAGRTVDATPPSPGSPAARPRTGTNVKQSPTLAAVPSSPSDSDSRKVVEPPKFVVARALLDHEPAK